MDTNYKKGSQQPSSNIGSQERKDLLSGQPNCSTTSYPGKGTSPAYPCTDEQTSKVLHQGSGLMNKGMCKGKSSFKSEK